MHRHAGIHAHPEAPVSDTWETSTTPFSNGNFGVTSVNGKLYAIGGHTGISWGSRGTIYATMEEYTPAAVDADDLDGDGMPISYEEENGLDPNVNDADADKDGDGISNIDEFNTEIEPHQIAEANLAIRLAKAPNHPALCLRQASCSTTRHARFLRWPERWLRARSPIERKISTGHLSTFRKLCGSTMR